MREKEWGACSKQTSEPAHTVEGSEYQSCSSSPSHTTGRSEVEEHERECSHAEDEGLAEDTPSTSVHKEDGVPSALESSASVHRDDGMLSAAQESSQAQAVELDRAQEIAGETSGRNEQDAWSKYQKHFIILTSAGKPIYSRHGDEDELAGLMALTTAMVSVVQDQGDAIQHVVAGSTLIAFLIRGPLYFVAASRIGEPLLALLRQLEMLHLQIMLVVSSGLERILMRKPSYDARGMLEGMHQVLDSLIDYMEGDATYLLPGLQPLGSIPASIRAAASYALGEAVKSSGATYGLLLAAGGQMIALESAKGAPRLDHRDVLVLDNFICCNPAFRQEHAEAFCPLCLPNFDDAAFLHAYVHFFSSGQQTEGVQQQQQQQQKQQDRSQRGDTTPARDPSTKEEQSQGASGESTSTSGKGVSVEQGEGSPSFCHHHQQQQQQKQEHQKQQQQSHPSSGPSQAAEGSASPCSGSDPYPGHEREGHASTRGGKDSGVQNFPDESSGLGDQSQGVGEEASTSLAGLRGSGSGSKEGRGASCSGRPVYLVLLSSSPDAFHSLSTARVHLEEQLSSSGVLARLQGAAASPQAGCFSMQSLPKPLGGPSIASTPLYHFMARMPSRRQAFRASWHGHPLYSSRSSQAALSRCYAHLYALMVEQAEGSRPNKAVWLATDNHISLALADPEVELFMVLDPLVDKPGAIRLGEQLRHFLSDKSIRSETLVPNA